MRTVDAVQVARRSSHLMTPEQASRFRDHLLRAPSEPAKLSILSDGFRKKFGSALPDADVRIIMDAIIDEITRVRGL